MSDYVTGDAVIAGVWLELRSEVDITRVDDSFDHEFGTHHDHHDEVEHTYPVEIVGDLRDYVLSELHYSRGVTLRNRRFWKRVRQMERAVERAVANLDPDSFWTDKQLDRACEDWEPPEPDYEEKD